MGGPLVAAGVLVDDATLPELAGLLGDGAAGAEPYAAEVADEGARDVVLLPYLIPTNATPMRCKCGGHLGFNTVATISKS